MDGIVIVLIVIGLIFIFCSFGISVKLEEAANGEDDGEKLPDELSEGQKQKLDELVAKYISESFEVKMSDAEAKLSEIVNEKTLALGDYAVTVNNEIERNHNEVVFLYSMLNDKQREIYDTATMIDDYRKDIEEYVRQNISMQFEDDTDKEIEQAIKDIDESIEEKEIAEADETKVETVDSSKDVILEMHKSGYSILEIAKHLGLGVGEVKLVVDLYQGGSRK